MKKKTKKKQKKSFKIGKNPPKKHTNVWIIFAFVFQRMKTNVMLNEHEFYVLWVLLCAWWEEKGNQRVL